MAEISLQRWDESAYSVAFALLLIWSCDITSCSRANTEALESAKQEHPGQKGGEVNASRSDQQKHMDFALNYCQSRISQRPSVPGEDSRVMDHENIQTPVGKETYLKTWHWHVYWHVKLKHGYIWSNLILWHLAMKIVLGSKRKIACRSLQRTKSTDKLKWLVSC